MSLYTAALSAENPNPDVEAIITAIGEDAIPYLVRAIRDRGSVCKRCAVLLAEIQTDERQQITNVLMALANDHQMGLEPTNRCLPKPSQIPRSPRSRWPAFTTCLWTFTIGSTAGRGRHGCSKPEPDPDLRNLSDELLNIAADESRSAQVSSEAICDLIAPVHGGYAFFWKVCTFWKKIPSSCR